MSLVVVIALCQTAGAIFVNADNNFADLTGFHAVTVRVNDVNIVLRVGLAHRADLGA